MKAAGRRGRGRRGALERGALVRQRLGFGREGIALDGAPLLDVLLAGLATQSEADPVLAVLDGVSRELDAACVCHAAGAADIAARITTLAAARLDVALELYRRAARSS